MSILYYISLTSFKSRNFFSGSHYKNLEIRVGVGVGLGSASGLDLWT